MQSKHLRELRVIFLYFHIIKVVHFITYALLLPPPGGIVITRVCLFVCLFVCWFVHYACCDFSKTASPINMKFDKDDQK